MGAKTLLIDGKTISADENATVLAAAADNGITIPTLCHLDGLGDVGACRICLVEVKGVNKLLPACTTRVAEGLEVTTDSERLRKYRRMTLELLFAERNHVCAVCVANGHCELQTLAYGLGLDHVRYEYSQTKWGLDVTHPAFGLDHNRCILCTRCVRVCAEIEGAHIWEYLSGDQAVSFGLRCDLCGATPDLSAMTALMMSLCEDPACEVGRLAARLGGQASVYVALCGDSTHESGHCVSDEGVAALEAYFNQGRRPGRRRIVVVPCRLRNHADWCRGVVISDAGLIDL